jgi:2-succinyl-5-enolpyruvyl-6-hydroxy-3-cyclohexene-1-carboxylate synthase
LFKSAVVADLNPAIVTIDQHLENQLQTTLERWPHSEPSLFRSVIELIPSNSQVYVGNSLPIREWDLVAPRVRSQPIFASRGANGIDGQLSTFFGLARPEVENWCFVGDLTALYDLSAPWVLSELKEFKLRIVIINNGGGRIFQRLFAEEYYQNCHQLEFSHWAQMWNLAYQRWQSPDEINGDLPQQCVIELRPSFEESEKFWQNYP